MRYRFILFSLVFLMFTCVTTQAVSTGYTIESLSSDVTVTEEGVYKVQEGIVMNFSTPLHGFYRVLPTEYMFNDPGQEDIRVHVMNIRASDTLNVTRGSGYVNIRLGDADRTVMGRQEYNISYTYDIGADRNADYDEFYFNLAGEDWEVPIEFFTFSVEFPFPVDPQSIWFSRGFYGSTDSEGVDWMLSGDALVLSGSTSRLMPGEALTVRVQMPEGYYVARTDYQAIIARFNIILYILVLAIAVFLWFKYGRDEELTIVTQFSPPDGITPLDLGYIIDGTLDTRDVTSMIFYWADKGCLSIVEDDKKFSFIKGHDPIGATAHEKQLFNAFFSSGTKGVVTVKDLEGKFFAEFQKLGKSVDKYYKGERALSSNVSRNMATLSGLLILFPAIAYALACTANYPSPLTLVLFVAAIAFGVVFALMVHLMMRVWHLRKGLGKVLWIILLVLLTVVSSFVLGVFSLLSDVEIDFGLIEAVKVALAIAPIAFLAIVTRKRSDYGQKKLEQILGFRDFIDKVEIDKLKRMIEDDPEFYYHILSYAIVMGLEKKWAKKFSSITLEPPHWYMGRYDVWNVMFLSSMLGRCNNALMTSVAVPPKTSSGGRFGGSSFGGGGFSGGGFGGGGGGAW
jgi:uncharacterized membrane protein YgcG